MNEEHYEADDDDSDNEQDDNDDGDDGDVGDDDMDDWEWGEDADWSIWVWDMRSILFWTRTMGMEPHSSSTWGQATASGLQVAIGSGSFDSFVMALLVVSASCLKEKNIISLQCLVWGLQCELWGVK